MTTYGYAERPIGLTRSSGRPPVNERAGAHDPSDETVTPTSRGDGTARRVHQNEPPPRPATPGGNTRPAGGRVAVRPPMPTQARRTGDTPVADPSAGETALLPTVPPAAVTATGFPSRPDPSDPATEVWTLVERAQAGEAEAFGLLYDRYVDTVFRFVYFRVGNRQLAEDLTSDTFLRALKRISSFTWQGRDLGAWLVTIARNLVADHFKSGRYRLEVTTGDVLDADREDRGPEGSPEAAVVEHITNVALLTAVKQLNPEQQECIVLRFLQGFSVAETARAMGKNEGAIKALQYRAVRALARLLPDGFQP
ncbi:RNA polymerase sigma-70 factor, ECF subfamily [Micromonospora nigra]|uniref:RNA polymerase sigma-70 factor, ECF subfamily n=1 Tax=Micromonospora nigra TaxID=145857 RepID=A0A1C6RTA6_9ACTN|nr:ECF subfamily RNA polymerase sigma factor, BldN family [Micromonospora nigra]SCL20434.1 RNA polymerase sigma-70 factor, ECF subfamily [Micromonospora nigra]